MKELELLMAINYPNSTLNQIRKRTFSYGELVDTFSPVLKEIIEARTEINQLKKRICCYSKTKPLEARTKEEWKSCSLYWESEGYYVRDKLVEIIEAAGLTVDWSKICSVLEKDMMQKNKDTIERLESAESALGSARSALFSSSVETLADNHFSKYKDSL